MSRNMEPEPLRDPLDWEVAKLLKLDFIPPFTCLGKSSEGTKGQLSQWLFRGFITYSNQTGLYSKTASYLGN